MHGVCLARALGQALVSPVYALILGIAPLRTIATGLLVTTGGRIAMAIGRTVASCGRTPFVMECQDDDSSHDRPWGPIT